jgi:hypothetical protein
MLQKVAGTDAFLDQFDQAIVAAFRVPNANPALDFGSLRHRQS